VGRAELGMRRVNLQSTTLTHMTMTKKLVDMNIDGYIGVMGDVDVPSQWMMIRAWSQVFREVGKRMVPKSPKGECCGD
jgi:hypothetical protein